MKKILTIKPFLSAFTIAAFLVSPFVSLAQSPTPPVLPPSCDYACFSPDDLGDTQKETIVTSTEKNLQATLNDLGYSADVNDDQSDAQIWHVSSKVTLEVTYLGGIAANKHAVGYYLNGDPNTFVGLFEHGNHPLYSLPLASLGDKFTVTISATDSIAFATDDFSFTGSGSNKYYTQNNFNSDGKDHFVAFDFCDEFVLALDDNYGDLDYQDVIFSVKRIECKSEPEPICGDGQTNQASEQCDDGNVADGDGCSATCQLEIIPPPPIYFCGDGVLSQGEQCDDENQVDGDGCSANCTIEIIPPVVFCGDGAVNQASEQCDDGNAISGDGCSDACQLEQNPPEPFCGDGIINGQEECDGMAGISEGRVCTDECKIVCEADLDVMMIMDISGSMGWDVPTRLSQAKIAANGFLDNLRAGDQSGLVSFSYTAALDKALSNDHASTKSLIDALVANGATNIGDAIGAANDELISSNANPQAIKIEILLTDGRANKPNGNGSDENPADVALAESKAAEAAGKGIIIFTIGLGTDVNHVMLQNIASTTGGTYYFAPTSADLEEIFNQIAYMACEFGSISGCSYLDLDGDVNTSVDRETLSGWKIMLDSSVNFSQLTDENGCFVFAGLQNGAYSLYQYATQTLAYTQLFPASSSGYEINITNAENITGRDFINYISGCGNNVLDSGEQCDDGNNAGGDGCSSVCTIEIIPPVVFCGNGIINDGEQCDDGNSVSGDGCSATCQNEIIPPPFVVFCGDGAVNQASEQCDDGNRTNGDGCSATCQNEIIPPPFVVFCGDGAVNQASEQCDDGNVISGDGCSASCQNEGGGGPVCGDGIVNQTSEQCDGTAGAAEGYTCAASCVLEKNICNMDLDVMMIMDVSGSMGYENPTKLSQAKIAASSFLDNLRANDRSGLVSFSWTASLNKKLSGDHAATKSVINGLSSDGATNIGDAVDAANKELMSTSADSGTAKIEILLTDGRANKPNGNGSDENANDVALVLSKSLEAKEKGIMIFTIGLGSSINSTMLSNVAENTGGKYYFAPTSADLEEIFNQIASETCAGATTTIQEINIFNAKIQSVSGNGAVVTWYTNIPATSRAVYGLNNVADVGQEPNYGYEFSTPEQDSDNKVIFHSITISGLISGTTYYWRPISHGSPVKVGEESFFTTSLSEETTGKTEAICKTEGESVPVISTSLACCAGLELIQPKEENTVGILGICTAKCGNGTCENETESAYNCSADCVSPGQIGGIETGARVSGNEGAFDFGNWIAAVGKMVSGIAGVGNSFKSYSWLALLMVAVLLAVLCWIYWIFSGRKKKKESFGTGIGTEENFKAV